MTDKPEKFYLVSESQLIGLEAEAVNSGTPYCAPHVHARLLRELRADCRKIEVPEWATDFTRLDTGDNGWEILQSMRIER